jgi:hypothetical protein
VIGLLAIELAWLSERLKRAIFKMTFAGALH